MGGTSAFVGLAALLHAATTQELQHLTDDDIDHNRRRIRLGRRPQPTPLDPCSWTALQHCLDHRKALIGNNSHVLIAMQTKATRATASDGYVKNMLRAGWHPTPNLRSPAWSTSSARSTRNSSPPPTA